jgi:hypothetical protein
MLEPVYQTRLRHIPEIYNIGVPFVIILLCESNLAVRLEVMVSL